MGSMLSEDIEFPLRKHSHQMQHLVNEYRHRSWKEDKRLEDGGFCQHLKRVAWHGLCRRGSIELGHVRVCRCSEERAAYTVCECRDMPYMDWVANIWIALWGAFFYPPTIHSHLFVPLWLGEANFKRNCISAVKLDISMDRESVSMPSNDHTFANELWIEPRYIGCNSRVVHIYYHHKDLWSQLTLGNGR